MAKTARNEEEGKGPSFEAAMKELDAIVRELEDGEVDLETSLLRYERGVKLLRRCHAILQKAERRLELLRDVDEDGNPVTEPFLHEDLTLDEKARQRSRRRSVSIADEEDPPLDDLT